MGWWVFFFCHDQDNHNRPGSSYLGSPPPLIVSARVGKGVHEDCEQVAITATITVILILKIVHCYRHFRHCHRHNLVLFSFLAALLIIFLNGFSLKIPFIDLVKIMKLLQRVSSSSSLLSQTLRSSGLKALW